MFYLKSDKFYIFNDKFYRQQEVFLIQTAFHSLCSQSWANRYPSFTSFLSQKLDDARFGIQPVDDDDGMTVIIFLVGHSRSH